MSKPRLRELRDEEYRVLEEFAEKLGLKLSDIASNPMALEVPRAKYIDLFDVPAEIQLILRYFDTHYSAGLYIGYIEGNMLKPGLQLARKLAVKCSREIKCIKLTWSGEKKFLYGRIVRGEEDIIEWVEGLRVVINPLGEPLGWGEGIEKANIKIVKPVRDLGWYLRRGG
ncbi:MAG: hypothetical protein QXJ70_05485 [Acidilobaceae archaeon]